MSSNAIPHDVGVPPSPRPASGARPAPALPLPSKIARAWLAVWYAPAVAIVAFAWLVSDPSAALERHELSRALQGMSLAHPLGFDAFGRDLLLTTARASILSSAFALGALALSLVLGSLSGTLLAVAPARLQFAGLRALEALLAFPSLLFSLAWAAVRGPGWDTLAFSLLLGTLPSLTRLVYVRTRELMAEDYVLAARGLGAAPLRIAVRHLLPGVMGLCRVKAPNLFASALMAEATLSFLGIGAPIGRDSWGTLLAQGKDYLIEAPHLALGSGLPLVLTVFSLQILSGSFKSRSNS
jgi:peptide/nickel transport system permease protein